MAIPAMILHSQWNQWDNTFFHFVTGVLMVHSPAAKRTCYRCLNLKFMRDFAGPRSMCVDCKRTLRERWHAKAKPKVGRWPQHHYEIPPPFKAKTKEYHVWYTSVLRDYLKHGVTTGMVWTDWLKKAKAEAYAKRKALAEAANKEKGCTPT